MDWENATLIFLIAVFLMAELYRTRRSVRGMVISIDECGPQNFLGEIRTAIVRLSSGRDIEAKLTSCSACIGKIGIGSEVKVFKSSDGYMIDPIWFRSKDKCAFQK